MSGQKCVVTGAGGFIGYHLANALKRDGHHVVGVDLQFPDARGVLGPPNFERVIADIRDTSAVRRAFDGARIVYHLASAHLNTSLPDSEYWSVNVWGLGPLLRLAQEAGVERFVHTSSTGVYGDVGAKIANETTPPRPQSVYGETKLAGEHAVLSFGMEHGLDVVVLRPAWVYGPGCSRTIRLCRALRTRRFVMIGNGSNLRHPIFIDDMIEAYRLAAATPEAAGQVVIVAGAHAITTRELIETFCQAFELPPPSVRVPYGVGAALTAAIGGMFRTMGRNPPVSRRTLEFFDTNNAFDISRARELLGFVPRYSLLQGLTATRQRLEDRAVQTAVVTDQPGTADAGLEAEQRRALEQERGLRLGSRTP